MLLDENLPRKLKHRLAPAHEALTVTERGWSGVKNGALLRLAAAEFDALLTMDAGIEHQQRLPGLALAVVVLHAASNDYDDLLPLVDPILAALSRLEPGTVVHVRA